MKESSRTFVRSLNSQEPVHILLVGQPGHAKTLFLKCILEALGEKRAFFTVGGNASKSGLIDILFDIRPKYQLVDEIEHLKPEYQTTLKCRYICAHTSIAYMSCVIMGRHIGYLMYSRHLVVLFYVRR